MSDAPRSAADCWTDQVRGTDQRLDRPWSELVTSDETPPPIREVVRQPVRSKRVPAERSADLSDLPLFAERPPDTAPDDSVPDTDTADIEPDDKIIQFPGLRL